MEFRLTWQGKLYGSSARDTRATHKHCIRRDFHRQLKLLWQISPNLKAMDLPEPPPGGARARILGQPSEKHTLEALAENYARFGYRFVPLATESLELACSIDILLLRPKQVGGVIQSSDIDGRLKTIFDALKMPQVRDQLGDFKTEKPGPDENPFFVLLQDDKLITRASVEADTLLDPVSDPPDINDARVIVSVKLKPSPMNSINLGFG